MEGDGERFVENWKKKKWLQKPINLEVLSRKFADNFIELKDFLKKKYPIKLPHDWFLRSNNNQKILENTTKHDHEL